MASVSSPSLDVLRAESVEVAHHFGAVLPRPHRAVEEVVKLVLFAQRLDRWMKLGDSGQEEAVLGLHLGVLRLHEQTNDVDCLDSAAGEMHLYISGRQVSDRRHLPSLLLV